jgi:dephospho-CoA kinase
LAALVVVAIPPETQLTRLMTRDGLSTEAASARLAAQAPLEAKLAAADYVIRNDAGLPELRAQVVLVHKALCERFSATDARTQDPSSERST